MRCGLVAKRGSSHHSGWPTASAQRPDRLSGGTHHQIAVLGPHALVGRILTMARALPGEFFVVGQPLGRGPRAEADRGLQERAFDEAALAGALPLVEGRQDALHRPHLGAEIANRKADRGRRPIGLAGRMHDPAHGLGDQVKAAAQLARGAGPKAISTIAVPTGCKPPFVRFGPPPKRCVVDLRSAGEQTHRPGGHVERRAGSTAARCHSRGGHRRIQSPHGPG